MAIGNKLKQILIERGITVKDFANKIGVPPTTLYSFINRDSQNAKMDLIMKICTALEIDITDLLTITEEIDGTAVNYLDFTCFASEYQVNLVLQELIKKKKITLENTNTGELMDLQIKNGYLLSYFDSEEPFTEDEMKKIKEFAEFLKSQRKHED